MVGEHTNLLVNLEEIMENCEPNSQERINLPFADIPVIGNVVDVVLEMERIVELALALITVDQQLQQLAFVKLELFDWNKKKKKKMLFSI